MTEPQAEPLAPDGVEAFERAAERAFHEDVHPEDLAISVRVLEADRALVVRDRGEIVATTAAVSRKLTLPGGRAEPVAGITAVGVLPEHTRRGHLGRMMRRQLEDVREAGESLAVLWASEGGIYGRYGYGAAARAAHYELNLDRAALRADCPLPAERARTHDPPDVLPQLRAIYDAARAEQPGLLDREGAWWDRRIHDPEHRREGMSRLRAVLQGSEGYALYSAKPDWDDYGTSGKVEVRELVATTPEARAGLWRFLLGLDLMRTLRWRLAADHDPLRLMLADADAMTQRVGQSLWVRLVDVDRALAARAYAAPLDVVLEVRDAFCPWNDGAHRLTARDGEVACEAVEAEPDLALDAEALGATYLGGTHLETLAAAGRARELRPGALAATAAAFRSVPAPWCPEIF